MGIQRTTEVTNYNGLIPSSMISAEIEGLYGSTVLQEMNKIISLYNIYEKGADFITEGSKGDYVPSDLRFKKAKQILDKEARFLFSKTPDIVLYSPHAKEEVKKAITKMQDFLDSVLKNNGFANKLLKAAKDCFIGKRVACILNFNEASGISVRFAPSLEFVYDTDPEDIDRITKIVCFYQLNDESNKANQRVYKKKYWLEDDGFCWVEEGLYNGLGELVESRIEAQPTRFPYIPAVVILNDGLTGDMSGNSEITELMENESWFSRLCNADMDAQRQGMNPIRYALDLNPDTTKGLSCGPGSFWDLQSDQNSSTDKVNGKVGILESGMNYSTALKDTLDRIKADMMDSIDMPDIRLMDFKVASGKALKAIYWGLIVRCDEKMHAWRPALEFMVRCILDGAKLYPESATRYMPEGSVEILKTYEVKVDNQYPIPEDEVEEKQVDVLEVTSGTLSRKSYMKKWRNLTDEEVEAELEQIKKEREIFGEGATNDQVKVDPRAGAQANAAYNGNKRSNSQGQKEGKPTSTESGK